MTFFFFIIVGGIIVFLFVQRQNNVSGEWSQAASRLGLNYSRGGLFNPHWIYGKKAGLRYDIKTFSRSVGGSSNQKWTGYRVRFGAGAGMRIRVTESTRKRLTSRFQECEIDHEGIFCARPGIESDAPSIIDHAERIQSVTARLMAAAEEEAEEEAASAKPEPPTPPPPVPVAISEPDSDLPLADKVEEETPDSDESGSTEEAEYVFELDSEPGEEPTPVPDTSNDEADSAIEDPPHSGSSEDEDVDEDEHISSELPPVSASPRSEVTLATVSADLFDSGRNHFQITQHFDREFNGLSMMGEGKLVRAAPYSNDRIFGRGPGTLAEIEIGHPEEPLSGHGTICAVIQLPETTTARSLRENIGDTVTISGKMLRCDAFEGRIFLGTGEIA